MRWLLLTDGLSPFEMGGMQKHSVNLLRQLLLSGDEVDVAHCVTRANHKVSSAEIGEKLEITLNDSVKIKQFIFPSLGKLPGHYIKESYAYSAELFQYYSKQNKKWDVVFSQGFTGWKFIEERKKGKWHIPIVNHFHGLEMFQTMTGWRAKMEQWLFKSPVKWNLHNADATISLGGRINNILSEQGITPQRIIHLPVAIDKNWFEKADSIQDQSHRRLLFVGRFEARKGLGNLLTAFEKVMASDQDLKLTVVGNIPHSQRRKIPNVNFHGPIQDERDMKQIMDLHHVLVVPSLAEGMPTVILEAMSRGMAIMCTPVGANEVMVGEENGWVLKSYSIDSIEDGLNLLKETSFDQIQQMGKMGFEKCRKFWVWDHVIQDFRKEVMHRFIINEN